MKYSIRATMSIKISFMRYMRWIRVMLPDVFEEFEVVYVFLATFCFSLSLSIGKRSTLGKKVLPKYYLHHYLSYFLYFTGL